MTQFGRHFLQIAFVLILTPMALGDALPVVRDDPMTAARTAWYRQATFGMFVHWGLYSIPAGEWDGKPIDNYGEWIMSTARISIPEYETLARDFRPANFNAKAWTVVAKEAGMTYLIMTAKHHDGFCMWPTKVLPYNVYDATPFHRDPLREVKTACDESGIRFGVYYSIMDWHHAELAGYWHAQAGAAKNPEKPGMPDDPRVTLYVETQLKPQLRELIENYRPAVLWFDGEWVPWWTPALGAELESYCRKLDPQVLINNRVGKRTPDDGDFETPEQNIIQNGAPLRLWETCMTLNDTWGYKKSDRNWKSSEEIVKAYRRLAKDGGHLLLNVGPDANGEIPAESVRILREVGVHLAERQP